VGSEWAKEAVRRAEEISLELAASGGGASLAYQRREARFALKASGATEYFSAHDYETRNCERVRNFCAFGAKPQGGCYKPGQRSRR